MAGPALSAPPARCHCLYGLPVHRGIVFAPRPGTDRRQLSAHIRYMPTLEWLALILAKRGRRRIQRLISWRAMINEHAQKVRVKRGYCMYFRLVGVSGRSRGSRPDPPPALYQGALPGTCDGIFGCRRHVCASRQTGRCPAFCARHGVLAVPADVGARLTAIRDQQAQGKRDAAHGALSYLQRPGTAALDGCQ